MNGFKLVRAQRPQTRNNFEMIVLKETEKQFKGVEVSPNFSEEMKEEHGAYSVTGVPLFGDNVESVEVVSTLNKYHCTNYVESRININDLSDHVMDILRKVKMKIDEGDKQ